MKDPIVIYDIRTDEYSVYLEHRANNDFVCNVYVKHSDSVRHMVNVYAEQPTIAQMLGDVLSYAVTSKRPYKAGQPCDGSIDSPAFHLYFQLCNAFSLDPVAIYLEAYDDDRTFNLNDVMAITDFAQWQGVEVITDWNTHNILRVLDSLTEINNHQLRSVIEDKLTDILHQ